MRQTGLADSGALPEAPGKARSKGGDKHVTSFRLTVFGRGFNSRRLHHFLIQYNPVKCKSPLNEWAFLFLLSYELISEITQEVLKNIKPLLSTKEKDVNKKAVSQRKPSNMPQETISRRLIAVNAQIASSFPVTDQVMIYHLQGRHVIGVYPMLPDDTCCFLAADFVSFATRWITSGGSRAIDARYAH